MYISLILLLTSTLTNASLQVLKRQGSLIPCSQQGMKDCGTSCIDLTDTCCPDRAGGCAVGTYCSLGSNGEYGCCRTGRTCVGPGGVNSEVNFFTSSRPLSIRPISTLVAPVQTTSRSGLGVPSVLPTLARSSVAALSVPGGDTTSSRAASTTTTSRALIGGGNPTTTGQPATGDAGTGVQGLLLQGIGSLVFMLLGIAM